MAIVTTPLGLQKPDGGEAVRNGDNVIAANAQKVEDLIQADRGRLGNIEATAATHGNRITAAETATTAQASQIAAHSTRLSATESAATSALAQASALTPRVAAVESTNAAQNIRLASVESAAFVGGGLLMEDPTDPGFFLVGA